jgi:hypothetical protein
MARFEQQISEDDVKAAREKIAGGVSLRSAAAEIPCAPSTLSVRIRKAEAAEGDAAGSGGIRSNDSRAAQGPPEHVDARAAAAGEGVLAGDVGPIQILRGALLATRANGEPDWPTRVSAARALAALRPEELEPKPKHQPMEPSIVVYDLPAGAAPVLHRPPEEAKADAPPNHDEAPSHKPQPPSAVHWFSYKPADDDSVLIGSFTPDHTGQSDIVTLVFHDTDDLETAELWRAELSAGRLPESSETNPEEQPLGN